MRRPWDEPRPGAEPASKEYIKKKVEEFERGLRGLPPEEQDRRWKRAFFEAARAILQELDARREWRRFLLQRRRPRRGEGQRPVRLRR